uniref:fasciclin domain-containing protein n=1 Tax=Algoriphagus sp. TaxID=1872435 RepID=UPI00404755F3
MKKFKLVSLALVGFAVTSLVSCNAPKEQVEETASDSTEVVAEVVSNTVVDIAVGSADHSTLVAAVTAAGLVETLSGTGPFTIFAPTNAAFDALPAGTVEDLLKPENKEKLTAVLTYHVVAGNVMSSLLADGQKVATLNGQELTVAIKDGVVTINGTKVIAADLAGSNGVIHVVEGVLLPQ